MLSVSAFIVIIFDHKRCWSIGIVQRIDNQQKLPKKCPITPRFWIFWLAALHRRWQQIKAICVTTNWCFLCFITRDLYAGPSYWCYAIRKTKRCIFPTFWSIVYTFHDSFHTIKVMVIPLTKRRLSCRVNVIKTHLGQKPFIRYMDTATQRIREPLPRRKNESRSF